MTEPIARQDAAVIYSLIALITNPDRVKERLDELTERGNVLRLESERIEAVTIEAAAKEKEIARRERLLEVRQTELDVAAAALVKREEMIRTAETRSAQKIAAADGQNRDIAAKLAAAETALADAERARQSAKDLETAAQAAKVEVERRLARIKAAAA